MELSQEVSTNSLVGEGEDSECMVAKRDPHDQKLIALAVEDAVRVLDLR